MTSNILAARFVNTFSIKAAHRPKSVKNAQALCALPCFIPYLSFVPMGLSRLFLLRTRGQRFIEILHIHTIGSF